MAEAVEGGLDALSLCTDLEEFVQNHRPHGLLSADATEPAWNGYLLTVACSCGVVVERWVTSVEADAELISWARLAANRS